MRYKILLKGISPFEENIHDFIEDHFMDVFSNVSDIRDGNSDTNVLLTLFTAESCLDEEDIFDSINEIMEQVCDGSCSVQALDVGAGLSYEDLDVDDEYHVFGDPE